MGSTRAGGHDHRISRSGDCGFSALDEGFAECRISELGAVNQGVTEESTGWPCRIAWTNAVVFAELLLRQFECVFHVKLFGGDIDRGRATSSWN